MRFWVLIYDDNKKILMTNAKSQKSAIKEFHKHLRKTDPKNWSDKWEDLERDIIDYGNILMFGPYDQAQII